MLNILADALLIASRLGRLPEESLRHFVPRRCPRALHEDEGLRTTETRWSQGR
jgi:hypothetical protein